MSPQYSLAHPLCSVQGCQRMAYRGRRCARHLKQLGPDMSPRVRQRRSPLERLLAKTDKNGPLWNGTHCWVWTGSLAGGGYGHFGLPNGHRGSHIVKTHRFAYESLVGPLPEGLEIDHLCRNRACVNPSHLEAVTKRINQLRGIGFCAVNAKKTHCPQGHPYSPENTKLERSGGRRCIICKRVTQRRVDQKRRLARREWPQDVRA